MAIPSDDYQETTEPAISSFEEMGLNNDLLSGIYAYGFKKPTPIQERAIIPIINGHNVIAQGQPGSGKTSMIAITVCQLVDTSVPEVQALILSYKRESAARVKQLILTIGANSIQTNPMTCLGPTSFVDEARTLQNGVHAVSGTPARVYNLINNRILRTSSIRLLLLDESDEMLNMGYRSEIFCVYKFLPPGVQVVSITSTLPNKILKMTRNFITEPVKIFLKSTLENTEQYFVAVEKGPEDQKFDTLRSVLDIVNFNHAVIFCNTKQQVDWLTEKMLSNKVSVSAMHDNMPQMERDIIVSEFLYGTKRVLITTAPALHLKLQKVSLVINYDLPIKPQLYIHRIGRKGVTVNLVKTEDMNILSDMENYYATHIRQLPMNVAHPT